jgi:hypothetical protein
VSNIAWKRLGMPNIQASISDGLGAAIVFKLDHTSITIRSNLDQYDSALLEDDSDLLTRWNFHPKPEEIYMSLFIVNDYNDLDSFISDLALECTEERPNEYRRVGIQTGEFKKGKAKALVINMVGNLQNITLT